MGVSLQREVGTPGVNSLYHRMTHHISFGSHCITWDKHPMSCYIMICHNPFHRWKRDVVLHVNNPIRGISFYWCWITFSAEQMRAFHINEMDPNGEIRYIVGGVPCFAKTMASQMRVFNINETAQCLWVILQRGLSNRRLFCYIIE